MPKVKPEQQIEDTGPTIFTMDQVKTTKVDWLWEGRVPYGAATILDGEAGIGKSTLATLLAVEVTTKKRRLPGKRRGPQRVYWATKEEDYNSVVIPRLCAAGVNPTLCIFPGTDLNPHFWDTLSFPDDLAKLEKDLLENNVGLAVFDPLSSFASKSYDLNHEQPARAVMEPLNKVAQRTGTAFLFPRHPRKGKSDSPINLGLGSKAIIAVARVGLFLAKHPKDEDRRCLSVLKCNLGQKAKTAVLSTYEAKGFKLMRLEGESDLSSEELVRGGEQPGKRDEIEEAKEVLATILKNGPMPVKEIEKVMNDAKINFSQAREAKAELGILHHREIVEQQVMFTWHPPGHKCPKCEQKRGTPK
jgi:hypothetical protein